MAPAAVPADEEGSEKGKRETHEGLFKWINFLLLAGGLAFLLRKPAGEFFSQRLASIRKALEEGQRALEASQAQLASIEQKLQQLEQQIAAFKASATQEMQAERERLRQATAREAEKILDSARAQMDSATRAAKLELKVYAAQQALELAEEMIRKRLDDTGRRLLVSRFLEGIVESQKLKVET